MATLDEIREAMANNFGNKTRAAKALGISTRRLQYLIKRRGLGDVPEVDWLRKPKKVKRKYEPTCMAIGCGDPQDRPAPMCKEHWSMITNGMRLLYVHYADDPRKRLEVLELAIATLDPDR